MSAEPAYLTPGEVARLLQVSEKTVLRWSLEDATMPVLRRGGVVRFHRERLEAWLARQEPRSARQVTQGSRMGGGSAAQVPTTASPRT
jgi:excisionase family DNA binding protein